MIKTFGVTGFGPARLNGGVSLLSLGKPAAAFPARVATDADLMIAVNRQQTRLASPLDSSATSMTVENAAAIGAFNLLTIASEIVETTGPPAGNVVPISRGFDDTTPAGHIAGSIVSGFIDAYHHNGLVAEVEAIEQALGANLANVPGVPPYVVASGYDFTPITVGGSVGAGLQTITIAPVPRGVNGGNIGQMLWISGGTGTPEAAPIVGGAAVAGAESGTLFVQFANAHSGSWAVESASDGIQEAIIDAGPGALVFIPAGSYSIRGQVVMPHDNQSIQGAGRECTTLAIPNSLALTTMLRCENRNGITISGLGFDGNFFNQASGACYGIRILTSPGTIVRDCKFVHLGQAGPPNVQSSGGGMIVQASARAAIDGCLFLGNVGFDINYGASPGMRVTDCQFGAPTLQQARTNVDWWDTQASATTGSIYGDTSPGLYIANNQFFGGARTIDFNGGAPIRLAGACPRSLVANNYVNGLAAGLGTIAVTQGSAIVNVSGVSAAFHINPAGVNDLNQFIEIEGEPGLHRIKVLNSALQVTLAANIVRTTATGLRYRIAGSSDAIGVVGSNDVQITGNEVFYSGDIGFSLGDQAVGAGMDRVAVTGNTSMYARNCGLVIYGEGRYWTICGNNFSDNGQSANMILGPYYMCGITLEPLSSAIQAINISGNLLAGAMLLPDAALSVTSVTAANPGVFTCPAAHNQFSENYVTIAGATGPWAALNGTRQVTVTSATQFHVAIDTTGFTGTFNGTVTTVNTTYQRAGIGLRPDAPSQFAENLAGPNLAYPIASNVSLTGNAFGFKSVIPV